MTTTDPILIDALIAADYLEDHANFPEAVAILRQAAFVHLLPFCDEFSWKYDLCEPFVKDGYVYATDSRIALRIPTRRSNTFDMSSRSARFPKMGETFDNLLTNHLDSKEPWLPWPTKPIFVETEADAQAGIACPICRTQGHYYADGDAVTCVYCDATGWVERWDHVDTGKSIIAGRYWRLISRLPCVWYRERMREDDPIWFRFAGGDGLLMTIENCP